MVDRDAEPLIEILRTLVGFNTVSATSNLDLVQWAAEHLSRNGARIRLGYDESRRNANLLASFGPDEPGGVVLSAHTDVVPVEGQRWSTDPFRLTRREDRLYGRGTADMKGFIAACIAAAPAWGSRRLARPIHLALSHDEEIGCVGVPRLADDVAAYAGPLAVVIVGEPTGMRVADRHRGYLTFRTTFRGQGAHSSDPSNGASAIHAASRFLLNLAEPDLQRADGVDRTTVNAGQISGGTGINVVPEHCEVRWEARPAVDADIDALRSLATEWTARAARGLAGETEETVTVPPLRPDGSADAVELACEWGARGPAVSLPYGTEAGFFQAAGIPTVICGPGSIEQAHQPDEWIALSQLNRVTEFLGRLAEWARSSSAAHR